MVTWARTQECPEYRAVGWTNLGEEDQTSVYDRQPFFLGTFSLINHYPWWNEDLKSLNVVQTCDDDAVGSKMFSPS